MFRPLNTRRSEFPLLKRSFHLEKAAGCVQRFSLRRSLISQELRLFIKMLKSPSHIMFVASNVALLVHLLFYSTVVRKLKMEEFVSRINELENYEDLIRDLDRQDEEIQRQITILKQLQHKSLDHLDSNQNRNRALIPSKQHQSTSVLNGNLHLHQTHASKFLKQRKFFASTFTEKSAIAKLFKCTSNSFSDDTDIKSSLGSPTFSDPILNSLMALSHQFVTAFVVEFNLRVSLGDQDCVNGITRKSFLRKDELFAFMSHDSDKEELLMKLFALRGKVNKSEPGLMLEQLDKSETQKLFGDFAQSENFKNLGSRRYDIFHHVSGRWLNYDHSDTFSSIQALSPPKFGSNLVNSDEYIHKFDRIFVAYELSKAPLREFNLLLQLAKVLSAGGECIPTYSVFGFLLDKLGKIGLYNYQSMVYDVLPDFRYYETVFAESPQGSEFASRSSRHFAYLIGNDSSMLASLLEYQIPRRDIKTFRLLLEFLKPLAPSNTPHSIPLLPGFMQSQFSNSVGMCEMNQGVLVDLDTISRALNGCVQLKEYSALDAIISKLFLNLIHTNNGVRIVLNSITDENALICKSHPSLAPSLFFTESILLLLAQAYSDTRDRSRSQWLLPHIDAFLRTHKSEKLTSFLPSLRNIVMGHRDVTIVSENKVRKSNRTTTNKPPNDYSLKPGQAVSLLA